MMNQSVPPLKRGWLKKYSRSGLIKNWQTRYFVLNSGKIAYYQNQSDRFPYGEDFKVCRENDEILPGFFLTNFAYIRASWRYIKRQ
jgi:hypothetical protein